MPKRLTPSSRSANRQSLRWCGRWAIGKLAVLPLIDALKNRNPDVREGAAAALIEIGPAAEAALPNLLNLLKVDSSPAERRAAAAAVGSVAPQSKEVVSKLAELVRTD